MRMLKDHPFRRPVKAVLAAGLLVVSAFVGSGAWAQARDKVVVASKIDTEGALLGNMILLMLEKQGIPVENRI